MSAHRRKRSTELAKPKVTICIPTIGRLTYLGETLKSLESQTLQDYEVLILDSGSPEEAARVFREIAAADGRRRVVRSERVPMFANFNVGLREARGEYVAFFHDDDVYEPDFLSRSVELLDRNPRAGFAGSNYMIIDAEGRNEGLRRLIKKTEVRPGREFILEVMQSGRNPVPLPGVVFRREAFSESGFDERLSMHFGDYSVLMEIAERWDVLLIREPLMKLRLHGKNASNIPMTESVSLLRNAFEKYLGDFGARWPADIEFLSAMKAAARKAYRRMLLWGWISAASEAEGTGCVRGLNAAGSIRLARILSILNRAGLPQRRRHAILAPLVRQMGRSIS